ncbi:MAG: AsmA family protein [Burkholderiales bacterium]|nr:AsmA family protein [Burkholderiales bacterium]
MKSKSFFKLTRMNIRIIYWLSVMLLMVFIVCPMFFFFYLFDEDQVKQMLYDQFDRNNYHVDIKGKIAPKFWHGLSFEVTDLHVSNKKDIELLRVKTANCQLSWLDLVIAHYKIRRMALNDVDIYEKNIINSGIDNLLNWSIIDKSSFNRLTSLSVFNINSIDRDAPYPIRNGLIQIDQSGGSAILKLGFKLINQDVFFMIHGTLNAISNNIIKIDDFKARIYNNKMQINLVGDTNYYVAEKQLALQDIYGRLNFNNFSGTINSHNANLSIAGANLSNIKLELNFNNAFANQKLDLEIDKAIALHYKELFIENLRLGYLIGIQKNKLSLASHLQQIKITNGEINSKTCNNILTYSSPNSKDDGFRALLSGVCKYDFGADLLDLDMVGSFNREPLKLMLKVNNSGEKPKVTIFSVVDSLDLSSLGINKDKLIPLYYDSGRLPFNWLSSIDMDGNLVANHFRLDRINLKDVSATFNLRESALNISKLKANVYSGTLIGSTTIAKVESGYNITMVENIHDLNLKEMFEDLFNVEAISGLADLAINTSVHNADSYDDLHSYLNGKIIVNATHGAFQGVDFNLFTVPQLGVEANKSTIFDRLAAQFDFVDGVSKNGSVTFSSPYVIANGRGNIDFVNTLLNYVLTIKSALPSNAQKINSVIIPVVVKGDLFNPSISIQNIHLVTQPILREQSTEHRIAKKTRADVKSKSRHESSLFTKLKNKFYKHESMTAGMRKK